MNEYQMIFNVITTKIYYLKAPHQIAANSELDVGRWFSLHFVRFKFSNAILYIPIDFYQNLIFI